MSEQQDAVVAELTQTLGQAGADLPSEVLFDMVVPEVVKAVFQDEVVHERDAGHFLDAVDALVNGGEHIVTRDGGRVFPAG